jgi:hypothetical protein
MQILLHRAIALPAGELAWIGLAYDPCRFRWRYQRLGPGLLGAAGIGLALIVAAGAPDSPAELAAQGKATLLGCARRVALADTHWTGANAFTGPAGTLYAMAKAAQLTADAELEEAAQGLVLQVLTAATSAGAGPSLGPADGAVLALLQLPASSRRTAALEQLAGLLAKPVVATGDRVEDPWLCSLPSAQAGVAMARYRLASLPGFESLSNLDAHTPWRKLEPVWHPGDEVAHMIVGQPMSISAWEQCWWAHAHTSQRVLDCADLARTAWIATREQYWLDSYRRALGVLQAENQRTGAWFGDSMAPDSRNFSAVHGMAALVLLALEGGAVGVNLRVMG